MSTLDSAEPDVRRICAAGHHQRLLAHAPREIGNGIQIDCVTNTHGSSLHQLHASCASSFSQRGNPSRAPARPVAPSHTRWSKVKLRTHVRPTTEAAVAHHRPLHDASDAQDARLRRIEDRCERVDPDAAKVADRGRPANQVLARQRVRSRTGGRVADPRLDVAQRRAVRAPSRPAPADHPVDRHCHADVDVLEQHERVVLVVDRAVERMAVEGRRQQLRRSSASNDNVRANAARPRSRAADQHVSFDFPHERQ